MTYCEVFAEKLDYTKEFHNDKYMSISLDRYSFHSLNPQVGALPTFSNMNEFCSCPQTTKLMSGNIISINIYNTEQQTKLTGLVPLAVVLSFQIAFNAILNKRQCIRCLRYFHKAVIRNNNRRILELYKNSQI